MQTYDIRIPVGGVQEINVPGNYVYFLDGSAGGADNTITVRSGNGGDTFLLRPGQAVRLNGGDISRWIIGNKAGQAAIVGTLLIGAGEFSDNRISGSVEVIDGGKARTLAGGAFAVAAGTATPAAGNYARLALFNAANSGINAVIEAIALSGTTALSANLERGAAALANDAGQGVSKRFEAKTFSAALRASYDITVTTTVAATSPWQLSIQANGKDLYIPREPYILPPGASLIIWANAPAVGFGGSFEWYEEKI